MPGRSDEDRSGRGRRSSTSSMPGRPRARFRSTPSSTGSIPTRRSSSGCLRSRHECLRSSFTAASGGPDSRPARWWRSPLPSPRRAGRPRTSNTGGWARERGARCSTTCSERGVLYRGSTGWSLSGIRREAIWPSGSRPRAPSTPSSHWVGSATSSRLRARGSGTRPSRSCSAGSRPSSADAYAVADPAGRLPLGVPQRLVHGAADDDVPIGQVEAYAARARAAGDDCRVVALEAGHFEVIDPRTAAWAAVAETARSLASNA